MTVIPIVNYRQEASIAVNVIFGLLVIVFIILRIIARRLVHRPLDASDWCAVVAAASATGMVVCSVLAVCYGGLAYGTPPEIIMTFGPGTLEDLFKLMIPAQLLWVVTLTFSKVSILLLYLNLFSTKGIVWVSKGAIVFISMWMVAALITGGVFCRPFAMNWTTVPGGTCGDRTKFFMVSGSCSLITDLLVVILPLPSIAKLQMARYKKLVLLGAFSIGFLGCIFSAMRLGFVATNDFNDTKVALYLVNTLSTLEGALASILGCIPMLRPLFGKERRRGAGYSGYSSGSRGFHKTTENSHQRSWRRTGQHSGIDSDQIQLRSFGDGKAQTEITSTLAQYGMANDDLNSIKSDDDVNAITVKQEWQVTSHHAGGGSRRPSAV